MSSPPPRLYSQVCNFESMFNKAKNSEREKKSYPNYMSVAAMDLWVNWKVKTPQFTLEPLLENGKNPYFSQLLPEKKSQVHIFT